MPSKVCGYCKVKKPLTAFGRVGGAKGDLLRSSCKSCNSERAAVWNKAHPERFKHTLRRSQLKCKFGFTTERYDAMLAAQGGFCAICKRPETSIYRGTIKRLAIDHDHQTGRVRGLLCARCNLRLGYVEPFRAAIDDYLDAEPAG